ncbi:tail protein X [Roseibium algae]|uniref:Phage tail protein n=1 Tax=Roseibium algae TaxID=3123038 RepID=A0ABU8TJU7_9HYPH
MAEEVTVIGDNITLDLLLWRRFGIRGQGLLEEALELNPKLSWQEAFLAPGSIVRFPTLPPAGSADRAVVSLFG